jgi:hypothetical protein
MLADATSSRLPPNKKHALVVRVGEKRILHDTLRTLEDDWQASKGKKRKAEATVEKRAQKKR